MTKFVALFLVAFSGLVLAEVSTSERIDDGTLKQTLFESLRDALPASTSDIVYSPLQSTLTASRQGTTAHFSAMVLVTTYLDDGSSLHNKVPYRCVGQLERSGDRDQLVSGSVRCHF